MNYKKKEKSQVPLSLEINSKKELHYPDKGRKARNGYIYTFFCDSDNKIIIGYVDSFNLYQDLTEGYRYRFIEKRIGSKSESDILKKTLFELGYKEQDTDGVYNYSKELVNRLRVLGWPIGESKKHSKRYV